MFKEIIPKQQLLSVLLNESLYKCTRGIEVIMVYYKIYIW